MKIKQFELNPFSMNCYLYYDEESKDGVIIDPAAFTEVEKKLITDFVESNGINVKYITKKVKGIKRMNKKLSSVAPDKNI